MDKIASMNQSDAWCMIRRRAKPAGIAADVDRLVHHATIFEMNVESYRRRAILETQARWGWSRASPRSSARC